MRASAVFAACRVRALSYWRVFVVSLSLLFLLACRVGVCGINICCHLLLEYSFCRPAYLDEPYAAKYSKMSDAANWSTLSAKAAADAAAAKADTASAVSTVDPVSTVAQMVPRVEGATAHPVA